MLQLFLIPPLCAPLSLIGNIGDGWSIPGIAAPHCKSQPGEEPGDASPGLKEVRGNSLSLPALGSTTGNLEEFTLFPHFVCQG